MAREALPWTAFEQRTCAGARPKAPGPTSKDVPLRAGGCKNHTHGCRAELGERIAEARLAAGLSQGYLAAQVDLERTVVVRIEAGERRITALELFRLAEALGVPLGHLVTRPPEALVSRRSGLAEEDADTASRARYRLDARLEEHARHAQWLTGHGFLIPPHPDGSPPAGYGHAMASGRACRMVAGGHHRSPGGRAALWSHHGEGPSRSEPGGLPAVRPATPSGPSTQIFVWDASPLHTARRSLRAWPAMA
ncbi:helix-turn-helix domain-containing protein [Streptomyces johnsoniae]|uniref:Helix-turn-helix transcriptional regulator n=1 Tax=Streptomyces johnsoniae TaxID=3075532 RepID=A0ABU2RZU4_9ACTN|nr:helix-turn-helix transcriptional regulator [Streptomyces sp. DSM 41886]MDT0441946.1 helix-turn-helix transcriptional regulator [Streptomyces sp. DSM 41886]